MNLNFEFDINLRQQVGFEPIWKNKVERWYQLDETSFALCEAVHFWKSQSQLSEFDQLIFVCQKASNLADADFVISGQASSPAKFVYTLASIAPSVVNQLIGWSGPVYCFCADSKFELAMNFAYKIAQKNFELNGVKTFIVYTSPCLKDGRYRVVNGALCVI